jgi:5'-nucleotidase
MRRRPGLRAAAAAVAALAVVACGGDDGGEAGEREPAQTTTTVVVEEIDILVTNDDGVDSEGLDLLVRALETLDAVAVTVVAPADQQSGTGGAVTEGDVTHRAATTASGYDAVGVDGFPTDAVVVAFDELGHEPDLVISGINDVQNLGPLVDVSGTVGAARAGARAGVPALAVSQGLADEPDFDSAVELVLAWLDEHRAALASGEFGADVVHSLNVPTCPVGEPRGTVEVETATEGDPVAEPDCTSADEGFTEDIPAFMNGYATWTELPLEPAPAG